ncbi:hypothetical protein HMPREF9413_1105 [Paenibacillus sp. HGF7]|nr:hypothetical protein HMPREF9413_1105 [Paenibacillus sp. HGF7]
MFIELKQLLRSKNKISHNGKLLSDFDKKRLLDIADIITVKDSEISKEP